MTGSVSGHFPKGADAATHLTRVPFANTLGLVWEGGDAREGARVRLPASGNVRAPGERRTSRYATLALLDHSCSAAVFLNLAQPALIATVDLRCELIGTPEPDAALLCTARTVSDAAGFAVVRASAVCEQSGRTVALASSAYAVGAHPGMSGHDEAPDAWTRPLPDPGDHADFESMLGIEARDDRFVLPFRERLIGALSLPAVHGGVTAAALALAACRHADARVGGDQAWRPLTVTVHYLRAVRAEPTLIEAVLRKPGSASCMVGASASQAGAGKDVAHAECLLVRR